MKSLVSILLPLLLACAGSAQDLAVVPFDSLMEDRVSVDGYVDREDDEYPGYLKNPATGLTLSWGHDDSVIYIAVETRGRGWVAVGLGGEDMAGANMLVGFYSDDSAEAYNLVGKGYGHVLAAHLDSLDVDWDIDFDDETGVTCFEFAYPLKWRGEGAPETFTDNEGLKNAAVSGVVQGETYQLILAQNTKTISTKVKHTHRSEVKFQLQQQPEVVLPDTGTVGAEPEGRGE
ncbi:MAG: hypothetical protein JSU73_09450 [candidate division WOR-3 bacterium]|nr:MAG: hypothetical protein JSU73_09450 [candidate division WOR-3 bacterium]